MRIVESTQPHPSFLQAKWMQTSSHGVGNGVAMISIYLLLLTYVFLSYLFIYLFKFIYIYLLSTYLVEKNNEVGVCQRLVCQKREFAVRTSSCEV